MSLMDAFIDEGNVIRATKREIHLAIRRDGKPDWDPLFDPPLGDGSILNPYDCSNSDKLDFILSRHSAPSLSVSLPNTRFIFGPGIFRTKGGTGTGRFNQFAWFVQDGQEFIGAGMHATTLRLELPASPNADTAYAAIGTDGFTAVGDILIADMTIDAAQGDAPNSPGLNYSATQCCAIGLLIHDHVRIRRVPAESKTLPPRWIVFYLGPDD